MQRYALSAFVLVVVFLLPIQAAVGLTGFGAQGKIVFESTFKTIEGWYVPREANYVALVGGEGRIEFVMRTNSLTIVPSLVERIQSFDIVFSALLKKGQKFGIAWSNICFQFFYVVGYDGTFQYLYQNYCDKDREIPIRTNLIENGQVQFDEADEAIKSTRVVLNDASLKFFINDTIVRDETLEQPENRQGFFDLERGPFDFGMVFYTPDADASRVYSPTLWKIRMPD